MFQDIKNSDIIIEFRDFVNNIEEFKRETELYLEFKKEVILRSSCLN